MNGFQIKGSALSTEAVAAANSSINNIAIKSNDPNVIGPHSSLHVGVVAGPRAIGDLINVDKLEFPKLGNGQIPRSQWILKLKLRLKEFGANHYSLYNWPERLIDLFLAYPLSTVLEYEQKVIERNKIVSPSVEDLTTAKSWEIIDEDNVLVPDDLNRSISNQADPMLVLRSMFNAVFTEFPAFKLFFSLQMSTKQIQSRLRELYVGMWTARAFTQPLIDRSIPAEYWPMFSRVKILAEFLLRVKDVEDKMEWRELENLLQEFSQVQDHYQIVKSIGGNSLSSTAGLRALGTKITGVIDDMKQFIDLPREFIQHFMYVQLMKETASKLNRLYERFRDDRFDLERLCSMRPPKLLTKKSTTVLLREMKLYAQGLPRVRETQPASSATPPVQQKLPPSGPSSDLQKKLSKSRNLSNSTTSTSSSKSSSSSGSAAPTTAPKSMAVSAPWRSTSKKVLSRRGNYKWLDSSLVSSLKKKISQGTLTHEERDIVHQYSFVFHYELSAKQKRDRNDEAKSRSSSSSYK